jgi:predicted phosphodiesterase
MRYGIFADVHGNLEALRAVLQDMRDNSIDRFVCLGDIVGYGANPKECIAHIKELDADIVAGNHDYAVVNKTDIADFSRDAVAAIEWTSRILSDEEKVYLENLKLIKEFPRFIAVHSSLNHPEKWKYVDRKEDVLKEFGYMHKNILFIGHSHQPVVFKIQPLEQSNKGEIKGYEFVNTYDNCIKIEVRCRYIFDVGSVGQSRDGDVRASFAIYDDKKKEVIMKRTEYDVGKASEKIREKGYSLALAERLLRGT